MDKCGQEGCGQRHGWVGLSLDYGFILKVNSKGSERKGPRAWSYYFRKTKKDCTSKVCFLQALVSPGPHAMSQAKGDAYRFFRTFQAQHSIKRFPRQFLSHTCIQWRWFQSLCMVQNIRLLGSCFQTNHGSHFIWQNFLRCGEKEPFAKHLL